MNICPACNSKHNLNYENQIIFLITPNGEGWNYLAVKIIICMNKKNNVKKCW